MKALVQYYSASKLSVKSIYTKILFVSGLNILMSFLLNLLLPHKIGVAAYGDYRYLYSLIGFAGIFHLGYLDGFYLVSLNQKADRSVSISYLSILVLAGLAVANTIMHFMGIELGIHAFLICFIFLVSNYVNLLGICNNINQSFLLPVIIQLMVTISLLVAINSPVLVEILVSNINLSILVLLLLQLTLLFILNMGEQKLSLILLGLGSFSTIKKYHEKGIKTLAIGLIIMTTLGIDKIILKPYLTKENYGAYCFSNSFLVSLLGLSLSISNKFVSELYQNNWSDFKNKYNQIVRNISFFSLLLIVISFFAQKTFGINLAEYQHLIVHITACFGLFSFLFIIQLLHGNLVKLHNLEIQFFSFYFVFVGINCLIFYFLNSNISQMLLITSMVYYIAIILFDYLFIRNRCKFELSFQNKIIALLPILLEWLIIYL